MTLNRNIIERVRLMAKESNHNYTEDKIKTLSPLEHIRARSGMYIGRLGDGTQYDDGVYILLKEVIDNSIDEYIMGFGDKIEIRLDDKRASVRDYGRGIPLGKLEDCVSIINTGGKFNDDVFQFSVGLNGVGTKAVNALSSFFRVISIRDGKCVEAVFEKGKLKSNTVVGTSHTNMAIEEDLNNEGINLIRTDIGDKYVLAKLIEKNLSLGGEQSGHIILKDLATTGDGILTAIMLTEEVCETKSSLSKLCDKVEIYPQTIEYFPLQQVDTILFHHSETT